MSERFTSMFFTLVLLVNIYFFEKIEPNELKNQTDRLLALFLFQFDYFFLFVYIFSRLIKRYHDSLLLLTVCYGGLFTLGLSSFIITDEKEFDIVYSYIQAVLRMILVTIFIKMGIRKYVIIENKNYLLYILGALGGLYFGYLLNRHPRIPMWSFNLYWVLTMVFCL